jgi:hypothetical protein
VRAAKPLAPPIFPYLLRRSPQWLLYALDESDDGVYLVVG